MHRIPPILQIGDVLISSDIITEHFCCDLTACKGICCVEGDAGAPVTLDEIAAIEDSLDAVWPNLSASAQSVIDSQGVAYTDRDGDLVTSIVAGRDCVFTIYDDLTLDAPPPSSSAERPADSPLESSTVVPTSPTTVEHCCLCAIEAACRAGKTAFRKPISCALYPIREKRFSDGTLALNYHRWDVCRPAVALGRQLHLPLYKFLEGPLVQRLGREWYTELCEVAAQLLPPNS